MGKAGGKGAGRGMRGECIHAIEGSTEAATLVGAVVAVQIALAAGGRRRGRKGGAMKIVRTTVVPPSILDWGRESMSYE